jgi:hypothetical protein
MLLKRTLINCMTEDYYYPDSDFAIGNTIDVFGRQFFLYGTNGFTWLFLDNIYCQRDWTPIDVDEYLQEKMFKQNLSPSKKERDSYNNRLYEKYDFFKFK